MTSAVPDPSEVPRLVQALLKARAKSLGAGNRRSLFANFDGLLVNEDGTVDQLLGRDELEGGEGSYATVRLRRLRMHNWRSFERADLVLADAGSDRPLFIVGGQNGYGKSSILEAFSYGIFGRRAGSELGAIGAGTGRAASRRTYATFMEQVLHRSDRARSEGYCSVRLDFDTTEGPIEIERKWYFDDKGLLIEEDEELLVRHGGDRSLLQIPAGETSQDWIQEEIERRIMPAGLAPFFIFDGEQIERWADRKLSDQVRVAIERILGLEDLTGLIEDLRAYARDRERGIGASDTESIDLVRERMDRLRSAMDSARLRLSTTEQEVAFEREHRERALVSLAITSSDSHADLKPLLERTHALDAERDRLRRELAAVLSEVGPFILLGSALMLKTADEVEDEGRHLSALELDHADFDQLWFRFAAIRPPLDRSTAKAMRARLQKAWAPDAVSNDRRRVHLHLGGTDHRAVASKLRSARGDGIEKMTVLRLELERVMAEAGRLAAEKQTSERRDVEKEQARQDLAAITLRLESAEGQRREIERELSLLEASLLPDIQEMERRDAHLNALAPIAMSVTKAREIAADIDLWIKRRSAEQYERFAAAVGGSFLGLSHKEQIARIEIRRDGGVALFDRSGTDVTEYRLSAGENQLFALALIAAVAEVTGRELPLIVDTPLSRLDTAHRAGVLRMLAKRKGQTILLTQPEEIGERHLASLSHSIAGTMKISHQLCDDTGVGVSHFAEGYLEELAA